MKRKVSFLGLAICLLAISIIGGSIAYFRTETEGVNTISAGNLGVDLKLGQEADENNVVDDGLVLDGAVSGSEYAYPLYAENDGDFDSYIRVTLTRYWENQDGEKVFDKDASLIELVTDNENDWIIDDTDENNEVIYMYYRKPVTSGEETKNAVDTIKIGNIGNEYTNLQAKIDVEVDAIQKAAAADAILAEWGMDVTFNEDGTIQENSVELMNE